MDTASHSSVASWHWCPMLATGSSPMLVKKSTQSAARFFRFGQITKEKMGDQSWQVFHSYIGLVLIEKISEAINKMQSYKG